MGIRSVLVTILGVAVAGGSAYAAREYFNSQSAVAAPDPANELVQVIAAAQDIGFGKPIERQALRFVSWPRKAMPPGAFTSADALIPENGQEPRRTRYALAAGQLILASQVSDFGEKVTLVQTLGPNARAMAIKVDAVTAVGGFVTPGDRVDVLLTQGHGADLRTVTILQNIRVLGVDQDANQQTDTANVAKTVTVEVSPDESQKLALAQKAGSLSLTLRNLEGNNDGPLNATNIHDLMHDVSPAPASAPKRTVRVLRGNVPEIVEIN
jgi:pilus assembly protein CpaB